MGLFLKLIFQIENSKYVSNFEIVATYFYPKPYTTYGEFGRIRGKYPKLVDDTYYYSVSRRISIFERKSC